MCRRNSENQTRREARGGGAVLGAVKQAEFVDAQVFLVVPLVKCRGWYPQPHSRPHCQA
jgi:hypothetical protein